MTRAKKREKINKSKPLQPRENVRWPAEWEPHQATWIAWPHHAPDWPRKFETIPWVYAEIVRVLSAFERVNVLCHSVAVRSAAERALEAHGTKKRNVNLMLCPTDRVWLRDTAPTAVRGPNGRVEWVDWGFNGWAKYSNYESDAKVGAFIARESKRPRRQPLRPDGKGTVILEGGGIETDGLGTVMVTEEWLLSRTQVRNRGFKRDDYEQLFARELGARHVIWLGEGCVGDDTHGHVDDVARFVAPGVVLLAYERDPADPNHRRSADNFRRLRSAEDARGRPLTIVTLPYPKPVVMNGQRLPASYANFYIANGAVLVPTFNDGADRAALETIARVFRRRKIIGIHSRDLVWGLGTLHCLTQQQPAARR